MSTIVSIASMTLGHDDEADVGLRRFEQKGIGNEARYVQRETQERKERETKEEGEMYSFR
jgi:hypothetical protein